MATPRESDAWEGRDDTPVASPRTVESDEVEEEPEEEDADLDSDGLPSSHDSDYDLVAGDEDDAESLDEQVQESGEDSDGLPYLQEGDAHPIEDGAQDEAQIVHQVDGDQRDANSEHGSTISGKLSQFLEGELPPSCYSLLHHVRGDPSSRSHLRFLQ